jgi:hypothetical protein
MKKMILTLALVMFAVSVSAQPLHNFEYDSERAINDDGSFSVTGGETVGANVSFDNRVNRELPLVLKLRFSSDNMKVVGEEFDLSASVYSSNADSERTTALKCDPTRVSRNASVWECLGRENEILSSSSSYVDVEVTAVPQIKPGKYSYELKVMSEIGVGNTVVENQNVKAKTSERFDAPREGVSVEVKPSSNADVSVKSLQEISAEPPSNRGFVGGVSVDVSNKTGEVESTGTVTITYEDNSLDERDVDMYFYEDSGDENRWDNIGGTHFPGNNTVTVDVEHFSTYAAFANDGGDDSGGSGGGGSIDVSETETDEQQENETETQQNQTEEGGQEQDTTQQEEQDQTTQEDDTTGQETGEQQEETGPQQEGQTPRTPAGQFFSNTTSVTGVLLALILVLAAVLQYSGRIDLTGYLPR